MVHLNIILVICNYVYLIVQYCYVSVMLYDECVQYVYIDCMINISHLIQNCNLLYNYHLYLVLPRSSLLDGLVQFSEVARLEIQNHAVSNAGFYH